MSHRHCILCPGQGAQAPGMGMDFAAASPAARAVYEEAAAVLGYDLAAICFQGPQERLNQTDICQPALFATGVAAYRAAAERGKLSPETDAVYAGLSLGEYTALHLAGVFSFADGLRLVAARGRLMQEAAREAAGGMVAILGADEAAVTELCAAAAEGQVLVPANFNAPGQIVISGAQAACERAARLAENRGFKSVVLQVAGAFHSPLMQSAADRLRAEMVDVTFQPPRRPVYANVTAAPHADVESIKQLLVEQIIRPVRWAQTLQTLLADATLNLVELAPGRTLAGMVKKINRRANVLSLATAEGL
jgi:[acyl-carrier-protein] S-malonyltransferase